MKALTLIVLGFAILVSVAANAETEPRAEQLYTPAEVADELDGISSELKALDPNGGLQEIVFLCKAGCQLQYMGCMMNIGMICGLRDYNCKRYAKSSCRSERNRCEEECERNR